MEFLHGPVDHMGYCKYTDKLSSFQHPIWEHRTETALASVESLARAGFFLYPDGKDGENSPTTVQCYHCGLGLLIDEWKATTNLHKTHQTLAPNCPHVKMFEGDMFVTSALKEMA
jgi:hypothetical protein